MTFLGHDPKGVDGLFGNGTRTALQRFQAAEGMPQTTELTDAGFDALVRKAFGGDLDTTITMGFVRSTHLRAAHEFGDGIVDARGGAGRHVAFG